MIAGPSFRWCGCLWVCAWCDTTAWFAEDGLEFVTVGSEVYVEMLYVRFVLGLDDFTRLSGLV